MTDSQAVSLTNVLLGDGETLLDRRGGLVNTAVAAALAAELRDKLRGEVRFDAGSRAMYSTDASNYRQIPIGVVVPADKEDVKRAVDICRQYDAPILARGGGTALAGQTCNVAVVFDFSKYMNKVLWIDPERRLARVEPGVILDDLQEAVKEHGLIFGPDPATHNHCTIGGMIGNNSCGIHSVLSEFYGPGARTSDNLEAMEVLTYDGACFEVGPTTAEEAEQIIAAGGRRGDIYRRMRDLGRDFAEVMRERYPKIPRLVSGYENLNLLAPGEDFNVAQVLAGTECTCAITLEATVRLVENPAERTLLVLGYSDIFEAGQHVPLIREHKPVGLEGLDRLLIYYQRKKQMHPDALDLLPPGNGFLMVEFGGKNKEESDEKARRLMAALEEAEHTPNMELYDEPEREAQLWEVRESGLGATARIPDTPDTWPGWEDSAVHPNDIGDYLRDLRALFEEHGYEAALYGHFGQGLVHCRATFDLASADGLRKFNRFMDAAADLVISYGGVLSGEHGDGQARGALIGKMYGDEMMSLFREFKSIWDPNWMMNPGKVIDADPITDNLRLGAEYNPWDPQTEFTYPEDDYSFARAALRCVGVGKCRREGGGTMCPSYMVTREEKHSTRGRARLLFEMLQGDVLEDGWRDENVKEALDLCLACKGCKSDCPVNVDMATYKAEFFAHYYAGRPRPRNGYAFGFIYWWARLASLMPGVANFFTQTPLLRDVAKAVAGLAPERNIPPFARQTFKDWFWQRGVRNEGMPQVLLWPDTFNNFFHPATAQAAVTVLEAAGYQVVIPEQSLCCGRPLYDFGFIDQARGLWQQTLKALRPQIQAGTPVVGLEPSCTTAFRDELLGLYPHDQDARRLSQQTYTLAEFLQDYVPGYEPPRLERKALVHGHCHEESVLGLDPQYRLLRAMGLELDTPATGCCGLAGSFGFEAGEKYGVSMAAGERVLLPAVREADDDELILTNGFSCRTQIAHGTNRRALHLSQLLQMAIEEGPQGIGAKEAEERYFTPEDRRGNMPAVGLLFGTLLAVLGGLLWLLLNLRRERAPRGRLQRWQRTLARRLPRRKRWWSRRKRFWDRFF